MFTVVRVSGPIFYVNRFGERVELKEGDQLDENTLLNSPKGNQLIVQSPSGQELSLIVTSPEELGVLAANNAPLQEVPVEPPQEALPSSQATSLRADADSLPQADPQKDGHHHVTATVERSDLNVEISGERAVAHNDLLADLAGINPTNESSGQFSGNGADNGAGGGISNASLAGSNSYSALSSLIAQQQHSATTSSLSGQENKNIPITITGTFHGEVIEDNSIGASGSLAITGGLGAFPAQSYQGQYGDLVVDSSGAWHYTLHNTDSQVQGLHDGQQVAEQFTVHARNAIGIDFSHEFVVNVTGTNDIPSINGAEVGTVTEDSQLTATGQLNISDVDSGEANFQAETLQGAHGKLHMQENGTWQYVLDNQSPAVQVLGQNSQIGDTLIVHAADGTPHQIDIRINGTNDSAIISGAESGAVTEESLLQTQGKLDIQDTDTGEAHFQASDLQGQHGMLHLQSDGSWTYDLNNQDPSIQALGQGKLATDTITVTSADGTTHDIQITITGTNDTAVVSDSGGHGVKEDTNVQGNDLIATGRLGVTDTDTGEAYFQREAVTGQYGTFAIDQNGNWQFKADNSQTAIQSLASGQHVTDTATIMTADGTKHDLVVTITGATDHPIIHVQPADITGSVIEDLTPSTSGTLAAQSVDQTASLTWSLDHSSGKYGAMSIDPATGHWSYALGQGTAKQGLLVQSLSEGESHTEVFKATVIDSHGTTSEQEIVVHVTGTNDSPVLNTITATTATEGDSTVTTGTISSSDIDTGDSASYTAPTVDGFALNKDGVYSFDPTNAAYNGLAKGDIKVITIPVTVTDGAGGTDTQNLVITLTGTNDKPVLDAISAQSAKEDGSLVTGTITSTDVDAHETAMYTAPATDGFTLNKDGSYSFDPSHSAYQHLAANKDQTVTIPITVTDQDGGKDTQNLVITVHGTADSAVIAGTDAGSVTEDNTLQAQATGQLSITDKDDGQDHFQSTDINAAHGTLHLNADGSWTYNLDNSNTDVQALGSSATGTTNSLTDTIEISAADGTKHNVTVTISGTNDSPVLNTITATTATEGDSAATTGTITSSDIDTGDSASYTAPTVDGFALNKDGVYSFDPTNAAYNGLAKGDIKVITIPVTVTDGAGGTDTQNLVITLTGTNDKPVLDAISAQSAKEDGSLVTGTITSTDVDAHETATYTAPATDGFTLNKDGSYSFDPSHSAYQHLASGKEQTVTIPITVTDQDGAQDTQNLVITVHGTADSAVIAGTDAGSVTEDNTLQAMGQLSISDKDAGQDHFQAGDIKAAHGTLHLNADGSWTYNLDNSNTDVQALGSSATGTTNSLTDTIEISAADGTKHNVTVTISGTNDSPVLNTITATTATEGDSTATTGTITSTDIDTGDKPNYTAPTVDGFTLNKDGSYSFDPAHASYDGLAKDDTKVITIPITVTDGAGGSDTQNLVITLTGTNDKPVLDHIQAQSATEDGSLVTGTITSTDVDAHETASYTAPATDGFTLNKDGSYSFDPSHSAYQHLAANKDQTVTIPITVTDQDGGKDTQNLVITVHGTADTAVIAGTDAGNITEDRNVGHDSAQSIQVMGSLTVSDADSGQDHFIATNPMVRNEKVISDPFQGELHIDRHGNWDYRVANGNPALQALKEGETRDVIYEVRSADGTTHNITITVTGTNDQPTVSASTISGASEDTAFQMQASYFGFQDVDHGDALASVKLTDLPDASEGQFMLNGHAVTAGQSIAASDIAHLQFVPTQDFNGDVSFKYTVTDNSGTASAESTEATGTLNVASVNDAPVVTAGSATIAEDNAITFTQAQLLNGATDVDGDALSISQVHVDPALGAVVDNGNGTWTYTPAHNIVGTADIQFKVGDGTTAVDSHMNVGITTVTDAAHLAVDMSVEQTVIATGATGTGRIQVDSINAPSALSEFTLEFTVIGKHVPAGGGSTGPVIVNLGTVTPLNNNFLSLWNPADIKVGGAGDHATGINLGDGSAHRVTVTWESTSGVLKIYDNGHHMADIPNFHQGQTIPDDMYMALGGKMNNPASHDGFSAGEHFDGSIFNTAMASHAQSPAEVAKAPLASMLDGSHGLLFDVRAVNGQYEDTTGHLPALAANGLTQITTQVDTSMGTPPAGSVVHLTPHINAQDSKDPITATTLSGLLKGTILSDGHGHTHTITTSTEKVDIQGWNTPLTAQLPPGVVHNMNICLSVETTGPDGTTAVANSFNGLKLDPNSPVPNATISGDDLKSTDEDTAVSGDLHVQDADAGDNLFLAQTFTKDHGSLTINANGHWTFTPNNNADKLAAGDTTSDVFTVESKDGTLHEVKINLTGTNDAPTITSSTITGASEDTSYQMKATDFGFTDVDKGDALASITLSALPDASQGTFTLNGHNVAQGDVISAADIAHLQFVPAKDFNGDVSFKYTVSDNSGTASAESAEATGVIAVAAVNDAAIIAGDTGGAVTEESTLTASGQLTISDVDAGEASFQAQTNTATRYGHFSVDASGQWSYNLENSNLAVQRLGANEYLTDRILVTSADGTTKVVDITVNGTNDAPTIAGVSTQTVTEESTLTASGQLTISDVDAGEASFQAQTNTATRYGHFSVDASGQWSYNLENSNLAVQRLGANEYLTDRILVTSADGTTKVVDITVNGTNDIPTIGAATGAVTDQSAMNASGKISISDVDTGEASFKAASGLAGAHGTLDMRTDGTWTYTLSGTDPVVKALGVNMSLTDHVTVTSADGTTKVVDITINGSNDAPTITSVALSGTEDTAYTFKSADFGFQDADFGAAMHHITITTLPDPAEGALSLDGRAVTAGQDIATADIGKLVFTPAQDVNGDVHFGYTVNDGLADSSAAKATISLAGTPDAAVITDTTPNQQILNEDQHVYSSGSLHTAENLVRVVDPDGTAQNQFTPTGTAHGSGAAATGSWVAGDKGVGQFILHADGRWFYKVDNDNSNINSLGDGDTFKETLTIHSVDGTAHLLEVTVNGSNDAPTIAGVSAQTVTEDTSLTASGQLTITDVDSGEDHFQAQTGAATRYGHFSVDATGQWNYSLENSNQAVQRLGLNEHLEDRISVTSADGTVHVVSVTINGSNDAPVVSSSVTLAAGTEDTAVTLTEAQLLANASDVDHGETVQLSVHNLSADHGTITDNKDGTYTFTPDPDYNGAVSFTYDIQDPQGSAAAASASMSLAAVADTPIVNVDIADTADNVLNASESGAAAISGTLDPSVASTLERIDITDGTTTVTVDKANITVAADGTYQTIADLSALKDGTLTVTAHATSHDGTTATSTDTITKDTVATEQDNNASMNEDQPSIHGNLIVDDETGVQVTGGLGEQQGNYGKFVIHADGSYTYTPDARAQALSLNERQQETFNFNVTDKAGNIATETFQITLTGRNDGPVITGDTSGQVTEDGPKVAVSGVLATQDPDAGESSSLTPLNNQAGQYGHLTLQADGHWVYTLDNANSNVQDLRQGQTVQETFVVTAVSSDGTHTTQTLTIDVEGAADAPVLHSLSDSGKQHSGAIEGNVITGADTDQGTSAAATDSDSNAHLVLHDIQIHDTTAGQYVAVTPGTPYTIAGVGTLTIEANGHYSFDPDPSFTGKAPSMVYRVVDTGGISTTGESAQSILNLEVKPGDAGPATLSSLTGGGASMTATLVSSTGSVGGWGVQDPHSGTIEHSEHGQYGSLTVDPDTGVVTYQVDAISQGFHKTGSGVNGDVIEHFVITQGGTATTQMEVEVHLSAQSTHGGSGHYVQHIAVKDMDSSAIGNAPNDEPDASVDDLTIPTITLAFDESAEVNDVDFSRLHDLKQSHTDSMGTEVEERASKVFGSAADNESNDALQNMIADHLSAHHKEKADAKALADPDNKDANAAGKDASSDDSNNAAHDAAASAHDDTMAGSSSSHMDSLVPKPDDDTLPPI